MKHEAEVETRTVSLCPSDSDWEPLPSQGRSAAFSTWSAGASPAGVSVLGPFQTALQNNQPLYFQRSEGGMAEVKWAVSRIEVKIDKLGP